MRKTAAALIMALLVTAAALLMFVNLASANPTPYDFYQNLGTTSPDYSTKPPSISVFKPENNTAYATNAVTLSINVSVGESTTATSRIIKEILYETDWQESATSLYKYDADNNINTPEPVYTQLSKTLELTGIPDGNHSLVIYAIEKGEYYSHTECKVSYNLVYYYDFVINGSSTVFFTVDTIPPSITVISLKDETVASPDVDLDFAVNEPTSKITYSIDGQNNVTVAGNTTMSGLRVGLHNVTVYAWDAAGNVGKSETVTFTVTESESFPTAPVVAVSTVIIVAAGLLLYNRRKHG